MRASPGGTPSAKPPAKKPPDKKGGLLDRILKRIFDASKSPQTAQQSIPYREMHRDGICRVTDTLYTKTITFFYINHQLAQNEDKRDIFESYCDFLNYFDSSISVQLTFINRRVDIREFQQSIDIPEKDDEFSAIRREYADMLKNQLSRGNNGLVKTKYITFGIKAPSLKEAKPRLERIEADVLANFKTLGVSAHPLNGIERLEILHAQLHPDGMEKLRFNWNDIANVYYTDSNHSQTGYFDPSKDAKVIKVSFEKFKKLYQTKAFNGYIIPN